VPRSTTRSFSPLFAFVLTLVLAAVICFAPGCSDDDDKDPDPTPVGAFHPTEDAEIEGTMDVTSVLIPAGVTITVSDDLDLHCTGPVEIAGEIVGECVEIAIESDEAMSITGEIRNACATDTTLRSIRLVCDGELTLVDGEIRSAGDLEISNDPSKAPAASTESAYSRTQRPVRSRSATTSATDPTACRIRVKEVRAPVVSRCAPASSRLKSRASTSAEPISATGRLASRRIRARASAAPAVCRKRGARWVSRMTARCSKAAIKATEPRANRTRVRRRPARVAAGSTAVS